MQSRHLSFSLLAIAVLAGCHSSPTAYESPAETDAATAAAEAAAVAVTYALVLGLFVYRDFRLADLPRLVLDTVETTGVVMALARMVALLPDSESQFVHTLAEALTEVSGLSVVGGGDSAAAVRILGFADEQF